jgi:hypothetical protein
MVKKLALLIIATMTLWGGCKCCFECPNGVPVPICDMKTNPITVYIQIIDTKTNNNLVGINQTYNPDSVTFTTTYTGGRVEASTPIKMINLGGNLGYVMVLNIESYILQGDFDFNKNEKGNFSCIVQQGQVCKLLPISNFRYFDNKTDLTLISKGTELRSEPVLFQIKR